MRHIQDLVCSYLGVQVSPFTEGDGLWTICPQDPDAFHELFYSVHRRLLCIRDHLVGCGADELSSSIAGLVLLQRLATRFRAAVNKHKTLHVLVRFATKRSTLDKVQQLHRALDLQFGALGRTSELTKWTHCHHMYQLFARRLQQPQNSIAGLPNAEIAEILAIMKFELDYHKDKLPVEQELLLKKTYKKVLRSSKVKVPRISAFYIPSVDVEIGSDHEHVRDTICQVKRGVYDQETRLVAQYLSADKLYARQLFWRATESWHGFEHPNVAKMLGESLVHNQPFVVWEDVAAQGNFIHFFAGEHDNHQRHLWRMFFQVAKGLNYIHQQRETHGNLKCSHILVARDGTPKICHFELCKGSDLGGVDRWKSPEYNLGTGIDPSEAGDVYSFGLCIIEARTGYIPYGLECDDHVKAQLQPEGCYPRPDEMDDDDEWDVVKRFVAHNPDERPTMAQAIEMLEKLAWKEALENESGQEGMTNSAVLKCE